MYSLFCAVVCECFERWYVYTCACALFIIFQYTLMWFIIMLNFKISIHLNSWNEFQLIWSFMSSDFQMFLFILQLFFFHIYSIAHFDFLQCAKRRVAIVISDSSQVDPQQWRPLASERMRWRKQCYYNSYEPSRLRSITKLMLWRVACATLLICYMCIMHM